jgi:hypothetical protein
MAGPIIGLSALASGRTPRTAVFFRPRFSNRVLRLAEFVRKSFS